MAAGSVYTGELNEEARTFVDKMNAGNPVPLHTLPASQARPPFSGLLQQLAVAKEEVAKVVYLFPRLPHGHELPLRVYVPKRGVLERGKLPVLVWYHGGGYVYGSTEDYDSICRYLANHGRCLVVSVEYRLAPEHPFPAAYEDAFQALNWAHSNCHRWGGDAATLGVAGDSAGGGISVAVCRLTGERGGPKLALLSAVYPALDFSLSSGTMRYATPQYGLLTRDVLDYFVLQFAPNDADRSHDLNNAVQWGPDDLKKYIPRTFLLTAECDPLRADSDTFADKCRQAGVPLELSCYAGTIHAFFSFGAALPQGIAALKEFAEKTKANFAKYRAEQAGWLGHVGNAAKVLILVKVAQALTRRKN